MPTESQHDQAFSEGNGESMAHDSPPARISTEASCGTGRFLALAVTLLIVALAVAFGFAYWIHTRTETQAQDLAADVASAKPVVVAVAARPAASSFPLMLPGATAGWYQSTIFARVDGYVKAWYSDIGDRVKQGQVLAVIETPDLDQQLNVAKAKAATSDAQVNVAKANLNIAKVTWDRWREAPKGIVSDQERQDKQAAYEEAVAGLVAAQAVAKADEADVDRYMALEGFKNVTAPYNGIITARKIDVGDLISAGSSTSTTSLYNIAQSNVIRVFVNVPQSAAAQMTVGVPADITSDQYPGRVFHGKVARSAMSIDPQTSTQRTEIDIKNPDMALVPGMYVQVAFELKQTGLPEVPAAAILMRPQGLQVAVIGDDNTVTFRDITVFKDNGDVVIVQSGLKPGERVALNISSAITPGEEVTVQEDNANDVWPINSN
jgi:RND family efflux transporter MFP subunit